MKHLDECDGIRPGVKDEKTINGVATISVLQWNRTAMQSRFRIIVYGEDIKSFQSSENHISTVCRISAHVEQ